MKEYFLKNYKVYLSIFISFIFVFFIIPFFMTPGKFSGVVKNVFNSISLLNIPNLFAIKVNLGSQEVTSQPINNNTSFNLPTAIPKITESNYFQPTRIPTAISNPRISATPKPTRKPRPTVISTKIPTPTNKPKPSPTPLAPPEYLRPGTSLDDIFKKAGELTCVPSALLKAFVAQEAPGVLNWSDDQALFYNAYDWWHRVKEKKQICAGYGWYVETGKIPDDSLFAGESCKDPFSPETANDTYSQALGATQMLKSYWENDFKDKTKQKLKVNPVDRRVLIDSLVGFGIHLKEDTGYSGSCTGWDFKYVAKAACVNAGGTCDMYNYCTTICNNYNKYANKSYACSGAAGLFVSGSFCQFK